MLFAGCDPLLGDKEGKTVAHAACIRDEFQVLKLLFNTGVDLEVADERGRFPMHIAASHGSKKSKRNFVKVSLFDNASD